MSAAAQVDYTYRYPMPSFVGRARGEFGLFLATCDAAQQSPYFFSGLMRQPGSTAKMLLALSSVVRSNFYVPLNSLLLDPVVTCNEQMIRFEGFSGCCGVYARVDLESDAFDADLRLRGTTNVDFNDAMRASLAGLRDGDEARLAVGTEGVTLETGEETVFEKKVTLPARWIKGFNEVQCYQRALQLCFAVSGPEALRFVRSLPRGGPPKRPVYVIPQGAGLRLSHRATTAGVQVRGTDRLRVLEPLLTSALGLRVWADGDSGASAWEVRFPSGRFVLVISPDVYRGFSGEGQALPELAQSAHLPELDRVRAELKWQSQIDVVGIARKTRLDRSAVESLLARLGSQGLAGYDFVTERYFHRELPFAAAKVEQQQPRLKGAKDLVARNAIRLVRSTPETTELYVAGTDVEHRVRLLANGDRCSCRWFSKYQGQRGPCKHILAARLFMEAEER